MRFYPALRAAIIIALGIAWGLWMPHSSDWVWFFTLLFLLLSLLFFSISRFSSFMVTLSLFTSGHLLLTAYLPLQIHKPFKAFAELEVIDFPHKRTQYCSFPAKVVAIGQDASNMKKVGIKVWVHQVPLSANISLGDHIRGEGILSPFESIRNPGDFDRGKWLTYRRFSGNWRFLFPGDAQLEARIYPRSRYNALITFRRWLNQECERWGGEGWSGMWKGLIFGFRGEMDHTLWEDLRQTGLAHLVALSGLHIGFLIGIIWVVGTALGFHFQRRIIFSLLVIIVYLLIVPARGSTVRAGVMAIVYLAGLLLKGWSPPLNTLGVAALVVFIFRPTEISDAGFQLSFAATLGILLTQPLLEKLNEQIRRKEKKQWRYRATTWLIGPLLISTGASLFVAPILSYYFSYIPLGTPIFNLLGIPLFALIFFGMWITLVAGFIATPLGSLFAPGVEGALILWRTTVHLFSQMAPLWEIRFSPWVLIVFLVGMVYALRSLRWYRGVITGLIIVWVVLVDSIIPRPLRSQLWFFDVGAGDCSLWRFPNHRCVLLDAGRITPIRSKEPVVQSLHRMGVTSIDLLIMSHPEADHIGQMPGVVSQFPVKLAIKPPPEHTTLIYDSLMKVSQKKGLLWHSLISGSKVLGLYRDTQLEILSPPFSGEGYKLNDLSLVCRLMVVKGEDTLRALFPGDIEKTGEEFLLSSGDIRAELLKVPHHGSKTSTSEELIRAVSPAMAIISCQNEVGKPRGPSQEVYRRLLQRNVIVYLTSQEGAILVEANKDGWVKRDWRVPSFWRWLFNL